MGDQLNEAVKVIKSGDREQGRRLLLAHIRENPQSERAWLWLASIVEGERRRQALERVLEINPTNERARQAMEQMQNADLSEPDLEMFASPDRAEVRGTPVYESRPPERTDSTDTIALIVEIVFGFFGILGVGWLYAGNIGTGLAVLVGYWILLAVETFVGSITLGLFFCLVVPINLVVLAMSGLKARDYVRNTGARGHGIYIAGALALLVLLTCGILTIGLGMGGALFN